MPSLAKLLASVLGAQSDQNFRFAELRRLCLALGFEERVSGGHHIFTRTGIEEIVNLQPFSGGKAKAYQVKQVRQLILKYRLKLE